MSSLRIYCKSVLGLRCTKLRPFSSSSVKEDNKEILNRQLLKAGVRYLSENNIERTRKNVELRKLDIDIEQLVGEYRKYLQLLERISDIEHEKKRASEIISSTKIHNEKEEKMNEVRQLKSKLNDLKAEMYPVEKSFIQNVSFLPNNIHSDVPIGNEPRLVEYLNAKPDFSFPPLDYKELSERHDLFDFPSAAQCSGEGFYYLKGEASLLEIALIQYAVNKAIKKGYFPISTPDVVRTHIVGRCGYQARSGEKQSYSLANEDKCLTGTAEIPLAGMYLNKNILYRDLPIKLVAFGRCFRVETGGRGRGEGRLYRVHQFSKVELFGLTANEDGTESEALLNEMVSLQKEINTELGLHCRVLDMPTEDLGVPSYRKFDIEAWMPGLNRYGEVTSASNCTDYQSQRLNITYRMKDVPVSKYRTYPDWKYVHTVNGTACAIPRTIIALLETHQKENGSYALPDVLGVKL